MEAIWEVVAWGEIWEEEEVDMEEEEETMLPHPFHLNLIPSQTMEQEEDEEAAMVEDTEEV